MRSIQIPAGSLVISKGITAVISHLCIPLNFKNLTKYLSLSTILFPDLQHIHEHLYTLSAQSFILMPAIFYKNNRSFQSECPFAGIPIQQDPLQESKVIIAVSSNWCIPLDSMICATSLRKSVSILKCLAECNFVWSDTAETVDTGPGR